MAHPQPIRRRAAAAARQPAHPLPAAASSNSGCARGPRACNPRSAEGLEGQLFEGREGQCVQDVVGVDDARRSSPAVQHPIQQPLGFVVAPFRPVEPPQVEVHTPGVVVLGAQGLLEKLEGDRVGLIAFAGQAFLECPLTLDYDAFRQSLEAVDPDIIALGGTDIASAISEAEVTFDQNDNHKILVLITDGEDLGNEGIRRARAAAESGVTIYTVGVGSSSGELIPIRQPDDSIDYLRDDRGNVVKTRLDEQTLLALAKVTDGFYVPLGATGDGLEQVYKNGLSRISKEETRSQMKKVAISRFQWPLVIALVLLFIEPLIGNRRFQKRAESDLDNRAAKSLKYR